MLMESDDYSELERRAAVEGVSVAELIRRAVSDRYLPDRRDRAKALHDICGLDIEVGNWDEIEEEIELARHTDLP